MYSDHGINIKDGIPHHQRIISSSGLISIKEKKEQDLCDVSINKRSHENCRVKAQIRF